MGAREGGWLKGEGGLLSRSMDGEEMGAGAVEWVKGPEIENRLKFQLLVGWRGRRA